MKHLYQLSIWCSLKDTILLLDVSTKAFTHVGKDLNQENEGSMLTNSFCRYPHFLESPQQQKYCVKNKAWTNGTSKHMNAREDNFIAVSIFGKGEAADNIELRLST
ncbi:hypothetical protein TNCV_3718781 [Trichonephila clavipes]|nr:hypothetical protein TNCV_3718781 [Trichonephila clavipes]